MSLRAAFEPRGNNLNGFKDFYLKAKDRNWPGLPGMCLIRSIADLNYITLRLNMMDFVPKGIFSFEKGVTLWGKSGALHATLSNTSPRP